MDLSIIIPYCNEVPQILFTVQALSLELDETGIDYEIIAIDNRSDDQTTTVGQDRCRPTLNNYFVPGFGPETFECYRGPWKFTTKQRGVLKDFQCVGVLTYDERLSHWQAKNFGIQNSTGEYLLFLDAHVVLSPYSISHMLHFIRMRDMECKFIGDHGGDSKPYSPCTLHMVLHYMPGGRGLQYRLDAPRFCYSFCGCVKETEPYEVPVMSTCGMMVSRSLLDQVGTWNTELGIYGGGEAYMNFKLSTCGYSHWIHPLAHCWHYAEHRGYSWNQMDWVRNNFIAAYTVGGETWLDKLAARFKAENKIPDLLPAIAQNVRATCHADRDFITNKQVMTYDEYVARWTGT